jgi:hypothetical protein
MNASCTKNSSIDPSAINDQILDFFADQFPTTTILWLTGNPDFGFRRGQHLIKFSFYIPPSSQTGDNAFMSVVFMRFFHFSGATIVSVVLFFEGKR